MGLPADQKHGGSRVRQQAAQVLRQTCGGLGIFFCRAGQQKDGRRCLLVRDQQHVQRGRACAEHQGGVGRVKPWIWDHVFGQRNLTFCGCSRWGKRRIDREILPVATSGWQGESAQINNTAMRCARMSVGYCDGKDGSFRPDIGGLESQENG